MRKKSLHILLNHPWIYDFAAHDLWAKPLGLLLLGGLLRGHGYDERLLACPNSHGPRMQGRVGVKPVRRRLYGTGKFFRMQVPKPTPLKHIVALKRIERAERSNALYVSH